MQSLPTEEALDPNSLLMQSAAMSLGVSVLLYVLLKSRSLNLSLWGQKVEMVDIATFLSTHEVAVTLAQIMSVNYSVYKIIWG